MGSPRGVALGLVVLALLAIGVALMLDPPRQQAETATRDARDGGDTSGSGRIERRAVETDPFSEPDEEDQPDPATPPRDAVDPSALIVDVAIAMDRSVPPETRRPLSIIGSTDAFRGVKSDPRGHRFNGFRQRVDGSTVIVEGAYRLQVSDSEPLALATLVAHAMADDQGRPTPGIVRLLAAHKLPDPGDIGEDRRVLLSQTASTRDVTLVFPRELAGLHATLQLECINQSNLLERDATRSVERLAWPSEAHESFRWIRPDREYSRIRDMSFSTVIGREGRIELRGLPHGFALPHTISVWDPKGTAGELLILSSDDGTTIPYRHYTRHVLLPRDGTTVTYTGRLSDYLPRIRVVGDPAPGPEQLERFNVRCLLPLPDPAQAPRVLANARYQRQGSRWTWFLRGRRVDIASHVGKPVTWSFEHRGYERVDLPGTLSTEPVTIRLVPLQRGAWTLVGKIEATGDAGIKLPVRYSYKLGEGRPDASGKGWTDDDGVLRLSGLTKPTSPPGEGAHFSVRVDRSRLRDLLRDLYEKKRGKKPMGLSVIAPPDPAKNGVREHYGIIDQDTSTYTRTVDCVITVYSRGSFSLTEYLAKQGWRAAYREAALALENR